MQSAEIDISALSRKLADAVTKDCAPITAEQVIRLFHDNAYEARVGDLLSWRQQGTLFASPAALHFVCASWLQDIGTYLGYLPTEESAPDSWITKSMPAVMSMRNSLTRLAITGRAVLKKLSEDDLGLAELPALERSAFTAEAIRMAQRQDQAIPMKLRRPE